MGESTAEKDERYPRGYLQNVGEVFLFENGDFGGIHFVEVAPDTAVDDRNLFLNGHGHWGSRQKFSDYKFV